MSSILERLYYRVQALYVSLEVRIFSRKLGLLKNESYRIDLIRTLHAIKGRVPGSDVFIDVGTNEGAFSGIFAHIYQPSFIICIEPNEQLNEAIKANTKGYSPVIINKAISDKEAEMDFYFHPDSQMSSLFPSNKDSMEREFGTNSQAAVVKRTVPVTTMDLVFAQYKNELSGKTIFLKIDTQGNELEVIKGGVKAMAAINYCLLEYMFQSPYEKQYPFEEIISVMAANGFSCLGPMHTAYRTTGEVGAVLFLFGRKERS